MGNEWQSWYGHRVGRGAWRAPPRVVPLVRFRPRRSAIGANGSLRTVVLALLFMAVIAGVSWGWWQSREGDGGGWSTKPIEWNEVQEVPRPLNDAVDEAWQDRGDGDYAPGSAPAPTGARFGLCHSGGGTNCVVDGDTLWIGGQNVRLADIDAPETHEPRCAAEQDLGNRATRRLHALVNGGAVTLSGIGRDRDRYGRRLRIVAVDGVSVGETLVGEGLARWYAGGRRSWCG